MKYGLQMDLGRQKAGSNDVIMGCASTWANGNITLKVITPLVKSFSSFMTFFCIPLTPMIQPAINKKSPANARLLLID
jgi:hypothetical protein